MSRPLFYILDGHALAYRHYFANNKRPLVTSTGIVTSAIFGFARTIMDVLEKNQPDYFAVAFDDGLSERDTWFSGYKAHREAAPTDFESQIPRIKELISAFNVPLLTLKGYEADDVIGTVSLKAEAEGADVIIYSGDRDMLQLLTDYTQVRLYIPMAGVPDEVWDVLKFRERYGFEPLQLIDLKALEGDTSDNIPGVSGIGEKTATTLIQAYGSVEGIYEHLDEIKETQRKKLEAGRDSAFLSKRLATILRDVPLDFELSRCAAHTPDMSRIAALYQEYEFNTLAKQLSRLPVRGEAVAVRMGESAAAPLNGDAPENELVSRAPATAVAQPGLNLDFNLPAPTVNTIIVRDEAALRACVEQLSRASLIAFDTETTSTDPMYAALVGISLAGDEETGYYIPVGHTQGGALSGIAGQSGQMALGMLTTAQPEQLPIETVIAALTPVLTDSAIPKVAHNADYDLLVLKRYGVEVAPIAMDTMIAEWVRDPLSQELSLKRLARRVLHVDMTQISELIGTGKSQVTMDSVPIERAAPYAAADAVCTWRLVEPLRVSLQKGENDPTIDPLWGTDNPPTPIDVLEQIEIPLIPVLARMEEAGAFLDVPYLGELSVKLGGQLQGLEDEIFSSSGYGRFNINSPKQLNDVLFGKLGLSQAGIRKTSHGVSTAADVLDNLRDEHPIIEHIITYRELSKLKGTYVDALPALINPRTGRVHTSYHQTGTTTGRVSSSNPNLQNIPIRSEVGREVRRGFIAPPGKCLLSVDYSQVELRIMAHITREPTLLEAFEQGQDIHAATAAIVNRIPIEQVTKEQRIFAKRVNFGVLYGMGAFRLARESDLTLAESQAFIDRYFESLPGVLQYLDKAKRLARQRDGYLTTMFGRRRNFPALQLERVNRNLQQAAEREAINMPIQGTAADIIKKAMVTLDRELTVRHLPARLILQVHDELLLEVDDAAIQEVASLVTTTMEAAADLATPLRANASYGHNWNDMDAVFGG